MEPANNFLVIGGFGFIGANFVNHIFSKNTGHVVILDRICRDSDIRRVSIDIRKSERFHFITGNFHCERLVSKLCCEYKVDVIVVSIVSGLSDQVEATENDLLGITHMLDTVVRLEKKPKIVYVSTEDVYGLEEMKDESTPVTPITSVAAVQTACEGMVRCYARSYNIPAAIVRLSSIAYGCDMNRKNDALRMLQGLSPKFRASGIIHVDDAAAGIYACCLEENLSRECEVYNIGGDSDITCEQLRSIVFNVKNGKNIPGMEFSRAKMNSSKAELRLKWKAKKNLLDGLVEMASKFHVGEEGFEEYVLEKSRHFKYLIYGNDDDVIEAFVTTLDYKNVNCVRGRTELTTCSDDDLCEEIIRVAPSNIISFIHCDYHADCKKESHELERLTKLNLYVPWMLAKISKAFGIHFTNVFCGLRDQYRMFTDLNEKLEKGIKTGVDQVMTHYLEQLLETEKTLMVFLPRLLPNPPAEQNRKVSVQPLSLNPEVSMELPSCKVSALSECFSKLDHFMKKRFTGMVYSRLQKADEEDDYKVEITLLF